MTNNGVDCRECSHFPGEDENCLKTDLMMSGQTIETGACSQFDRRRPPAQRPSWDQYFMRIAQVVASRATCDRKHVGAVIVRDRIILATGYNGSIAGLPHCDDAGHELFDGHCVRTVHAEANAIVQAARVGTRLEGASIYVSASPCLGCFKLIANAGIRRIVFGEFYREERIAALAEAAKIELVWLGILASGPLTPSGGAPLHRSPPTNPKETP